MYYMANIASGKKRRLMLGREALLPVYYSHNGQSGTLWKIQNELIKEYALEKVLRYKARNCLQLIN